MLGNSPSEETTPEVGNSGTMVVLSSSGVPRLLEPRVAAHIERGRVAMRRLEEMFAKHPTLQSQEVCTTYTTYYSTYVTYPSTYTRTPLRISRTPLRTLRTRTHLHTSCTCLRTLRHICVHGERRGVLMYVSISAMLRA